MKIKKTAALLLTAIMLISVCACSKSAPLYKAYNNEKINNIDKEPPTTVDLIFTAEGVTSSIYGVGDSELIGKIVTALTKVQKGEETDVTNFRSDYMINMMWEGESSAICFSKDVAEVFTEDGIHYYNITGSEELVSLINSEAQLNSEVFEGYETVIDESNIEISLRSGVDYDENGNCLVEFYVINGSTNIINVVLTDCKINGEKTDSPASFGIQGNMELGFTVPFDTKDTDNLKKISFKVTVSYDGQDEPFIVSHEQTIKF